MMLFYWGIYGWIFYVLVVITFGVICYRYGRFMIICVVFYLFLGENVNGFIGDLIDVFFILCIIFGVCMFFGFGVMMIVIAMNRFNSDISVIFDMIKGFIIWVIIGVVCIFVVSGLKNGIRKLFKFIFSIGLIFFFGVICVDDFMFFMNSVV